MFKSKKEKFFIQLGLLIASLSEWLFIVSGLTYMLYLGLENFKIGLISNYFDLNIILVIMILNGMVAILFKHPVKKRTKFKIKFVWPAFFAIIIGIYAFALFSGFGFWRFIISLSIILGLYLAILQIINQEKND